VRKEPLEQFVVQTALEKVLNDRVIDLLADKLLEYQSKGKHPPAGFAGGAKKR